MHTVLYLNGNIYTMDAQQPYGQALAIDRDSGYILAVGSNDEVRRLGDQYAERVDLRQRVMVPGFIDAHIHLQETAYRSHRIDATGCLNAEAVAELVRQKAEHTPEGAWIQGGHWERNLWPGRAFPTRAVLDNVAPHHPVALASNDGHLLWVNSLALQLADIHANTPDPTTGAILRDGDGEPTGILQEQAATHLIFDAITPPDPVLSRRLLEEALNDLQKKGITTIHDIEDERTLNNFRQLQAEQKLGVRVQMIMPYALLSRMHSLEINPEEKDLLRLGGIKIFADGSLGSQTAAMLESFEGEAGNYGILALPEQEMKDVVYAATMLDLTIAIHAIGDRAAHVALNSIEHAKKMLMTTQSTASAPANIRYRIEHAQLIAANDLRRMQRMGVVASIQPFHAVADRDIAERYWGKRHRHAYAYHTMHTMGIPIALGSDAPVETYDPLRILYAATQRSANLTQRPPWMPEQALSITDALWAYTLGAAYAGSEEHKKGSLTVGKLGDAIVLREDILNNPQHALAENGVQATILGGNIVYGSL